MSVLFENTSDRITSRFCLNLKMLNVASRRVPDLLQSDNTKADEMATILKSIIVTRSKEGATIDEIINDYKEHTGENLLTIFRDRELISNGLRKLDGVWSTYAAPCGPYLWYCNTANTLHLSEMIKKQKSPRISNNRKFSQSIIQPDPAQAPYASNMTTENGTGQQDKFFQDNRNFIPKRNAWKRVQQRTVNNHPYLPPQRRRAQQSNQFSWRDYSDAPNMKPDFFGFQMIGDDFFLSLARWEMNFSFDPEHKIQQCGLCISGLTLAEAADRVMKATFINDRVIVNVGVADILHGHDFVDMEDDLYKLMKSFEIRGVSVILTTLSPIANCTHIRGISDRLLKFNDLIRKRWKCIDLWQSFVNERGNTLYGCFQPGPRHVTGSNQPHVLWNKLGRQRVIRFMKQHLASFL